MNYTTVTAHLCVPAVFFKTNTVSLKLKSSQHQLYGTRVFKIPSFWMTRFEDQTIVTLQIHIRLRDANDNGPVFSQKRYQASVMENLRLDPPAPIVKVHAEDLDEGKNGAVRYSIISGNDGGEYTYCIQVHNIVKCWVVHVMRMTGSSLDDWIY
jgi:hypothetical protein